MRTTRNKKPSTRATNRQKVVRLDPEVYDRLVAMAGSRDISRFVDSLIPRGIPRDVMEAGYRSMAADSTGEAEALEWAEAIVGDISDETR